MPDRREFLRDVGICFVAPVAASSVIVPEGHSTDLKNVSRLMMRHLGVDQIDEIVEILFPEGEERYA